MEKSHYVSVAGIVVNEEGKYLLIKSPWRGWEFPGGMVEKGESLQKALTREILEESGINVDIIGFIGVSQNIQRDIINMDFACKYISGNLQTSHESSVVSWFTKELALEKITDSLIKERFINMISENEKVRCFSFKKDPFEVLADENYKVGL